MRQSKDVLYLDGRLQHVIRCDYGHLTNADPVEASDVNEQKISVDGYFRNWHMVREFRHDGDFRQFL